MRRSLKGSVPWILPICTPTKKNLDLESNENPFGFMSVLSQSYWRIEICSYFPIPSMYGIFTCIWLISMVNVGKYTIHGSYGFCNRIDSHHQSRGLPTSTAKIAGRNSEIPPKKSWWRSWRSYGYISYIATVLDVWCWLYTSDHHIILSEKTHGIWVEKASCREEKQNIDIPAPSKRC